MHGAIAGRAFNAKKPGGHDVNIEFDWLISTTTNHTPWMIAPPLRTLLLCIQRKKGKLMHTRNSLLTTVLDREIEVPLASDVDGALGGSSGWLGSTRQPRYESKRIDGNWNGWEVHRNVGCLCLLKLVEPRKKLGNHLRREWQGRGGGHENGKPENERLSASRYGERIGTRWKRRKEKVCDVVYGRGCVGSEERVDT